MTQLLNLLTQASGYTEHWVWVIFLVFLRVGAAMALLPAFGEQAIPQRVRLAIGICYTMVVLPIVADQVGPYSGTFAGPIVVEVLAGLVIGIGMRLFVHALQIAGTLAAQATSLSQLFGGQSGEPQPTMSHLFVMTGLALAVSLGLHIRIAELFVYSYQVLPLGVLPSGEDIASWGVSQVANAFSLAFQMASPFIAASLIYNIALGVINRAMPQLMVIFVGAPALTLGGLMMLAMASPLLLQLWHMALLTFLNNPFAGAP
ncbi:flagellar biosynthetic protein FliR [Pseudorhodobacter wandonensis]|uniref:flagellar biosynthetic protein FliR n=1 Tax=Pseudorhodobacter wandonensis TaxID=1120568 RepID=UPI00067D58DD|nr:flagellar biosynthetic protein FliR [Pseudorhodobacter wandonensis]